MVYIPDDNGQRFRAHVRDAKDDEVLLFFSLLFSRNEQRAAKVLASSQRNREKRRKLTGSHGNRDELLVRGEEVDDVFLVRGRHR